jgi:hypothetical protein
MTKKDHIMSYSNYFRHKSGSKPSLFGHTSNVVCNLFFVLFVIGCHAVFYIGPDCTYDLERTSCGVLP